MIVLITCREEMDRIMVSHGVDDFSFTTVILPVEPLDYFIRTCNAWYNESLGEWCI